MTNAVIGGWQVNGIYTWQHGFPITITAADVGGLNDTFGTNRANLVGDPNTGERNVNRWFNTAAFAQPAAGALGNLGRNTERGPGVNNLDFALFKNFGMTAASGCSSGSSRSTLSTTRSSTVCHEHLRQPTSAW